MGIYQRHGHVGGDAILELNRVNVLRDFRQIPGTNPLDEVTISESALVRLKFFRQHSV